MSSWSRIRFIYDANKVQEHLSCDQIVDPVSQSELNLRTSTREKVQCLSNLHLLHLSYMLWVLSYIRVWQVSYIYQLYTTRSQRETCPGRDETSRL